MLLAQNAPRMPKNPWEMTPEELAQVSGASAPQNDPSTIKGPPKLRDPLEDAYKREQIRNQTRDAQKDRFDIDNQRGNQKFSRESTLRSDYLALPSVKNYTQALPVYAAGLSSKPDGAGDLNLIYAYAKVMDPNSVVREGEQASVANSDSWINSTTANLQKQLGMGGTFQPEFRKRLREEMAERMGQLNQSFIADRATFKRNALESRVNPLNVVGRHPAEKFKALQKRVLGRDAPELDFDGNPVIATGKTRDVKDEPRTRVLDALIRSKASLDVINKTMVDMGGTPLSAAQIGEARAYLRKNPGFKGSIANAVNTVPNNEFSTSPVGAALGSYVNMATGNNLDTVAALTGGDPSMVRAGLNSNAENQFVPSLVGGAAGAVTGMLPFAGAARAAGFAGPGAMLAAETAYGTAAGAGGYENPDRVLGGGLGALSAMAGNFAGQGAGMAVGAAARSQPVVAGVNAINRARGRQEFAPPQLPSRGERLVADAARQAGAETENTLQEASGLRLPMTPADASPQLARLAGSAVRYSPEVQGNAQQMFAARNRGQIDRFAQGVERDLGPVANIPQTSADLMQQARTAAAPLYDQMRATPGRTSDSLEAILSTDFGKEALAKARAIANARQKDPNKMGFDLDEQGEVILTSVPSAETLDYIKRGMDTVLEQYRNPLTGQMTFEGNPLAAAQDDLRKAFISEVDALNPTYADARRAYAGPASARDALQRGKDSYNIQPDQLRMNVAQQSPEQLAQMQLGYRGAMTDAAERARYQANPYDATLGSPMQVERLKVMNQGNPNVDRLLRQAELERQMQASANGIVGNSATQGRNVADQQFLDQNAVPSLVADGASMVMGGVPVATAARQIAGRGLKDFNMGLTRGRATQSANEMAPYLLNDDPAMAAQSIADLIARDDAYRQYVEGINNPLRRVGGLFGAAPVVTLGASNR